MERSSTSELHNRHNVLFYASLYNDDDNTTPSKAAEAHGNACAHHNFAVATRQSDYMQSLQIVLAADSQVVQVRVVSAGDICGGHTREQRWCLG